MIIDYHDFMTSREAQLIPAVQHRILIVDDEPAILFAYRKLIEREGMGVDICECLADAIMHVKARHYLAVIADMRLAGTDNMDGLEVLRFVRKERPDTKVILATGYGNSNIEQAALALGASHYFEKPVLPTVILEVLTKLSSAAGAKMPGTI